jgi:hypothetical protein
MKPTDKIDPATFDWSVIDALTDEQIHTAAMADQTRGQ